MRGGSIYWPGVWFQILSYGLGGALIGYFTLRSVRRRRLDPGLLLCLGTLSIFWMEAPFDWAMYAQFHPDLPRGPRWGPLGLTWGGLPALTAPGYVMYIVTPCLLAVAVARRLSARFGWNGVRTLLAAGLAMGFLWDLPLEILGIRLGLWRFGRAAPGLVLFPETKYQFPLYVSLAMGLLFMGGTYLLGRVDDRGDTVVEGWARRRTSSPRGRMALAVAGSILLVHVFFVASFVPHLITKQAKLNTVVSHEPLFPGVPNQPV